MDIIALIDTYVRGLLHAEEKFLCHLDALPELEQTVSRLNNQMAAGFIGLVLSNADRLIRESGIRKAKLLFFVKCFFSKKPSEFPVFTEGFSLFLA